MGQSEAGLAKLRATWAAKRGFTDEQVLELLHNGETLDAICIALDASERTIERVCLRHGLPVVKNQKPESPWTDEAIAILRDGWVTGKSTAAIARQLDVSKCAIIGKAGRLDLPPRGNPIHRDPEGAPKRKRAVTARPGRPKQEGPPAPLPPLPKVRIRVAPKPVIVAGPPPEPAPIPTRRGKITECAWPIGTPRTRDFHFCDAPTEPGQPYCTEHLKSRKLAA